MSFCLFVYKKSGDWNGQGKLKYTVGGDTDETF